MQWLPERGKGGPLALMLLAVLLVLLWAFLLEPYFSTLSEVRQDLHGKQQLLVRLRQSAAEIPRLRQRLEAVRAMQQQSDLFLPETDFNRAAANLTSRLKKLAVEQGNCQVTSTQNKHSRVKEPYEAVIVQVRLRCELEQLLPILHALESGEPAILIDNLQISRQVYRRPRRGGKGSKLQPLDIRFEMRGYLKPEAGRGGHAA